MSELDEALQKVRKTPFVDLSKQSADIDGHDPSAQFANWKWWRSIKDERHPTYTHTHIIHTLTHMYHKHTRQDLRRALDIFTFLCQQSFDRSPRGLIVFCVQHRIRKFAFPKLRAMILNAHTGGGGPQGIARRAAPVAARARGHAAGCTGRPPGDARGVPFGFSLCWGVKSLGAVWLNLYFCPYFFAYSMNSNQHSQRSAILSVLNFFRKTPELVNNFDWDWFSNLDLVELTTSHLHLHFFVAKCLPLTSIGSKQVFFRLNLTPKPCSGKSCCISCLRHQTSHVGQAPLAVWLAPNTKFILSFLSGVCTWTQLHFSHQNA